MGPRAPYGQAHPGGGQAHPGGRQGPTANAACLASWPWDPGPMQCVHPSPCLFLVSCCLQMAPCPKCCLVQDAPKQELHPAALVAKSLRYRPPGAHSGYRGPAVLLPFQPISPSELMGGMHSGRILSGWSQLTGLLSTGTGGTVEDAVSFNGSGRASGLAGSQMAALRVMARAPFPGQPCSSWPHPYSQAQMKQHCGQFHCAGVINQETARVGAVGRGGSSGVLSPASSFRWS